MMDGNGAGSLLAERCAAAPKGNWVAIDGGSASENDIAAIRKLCPARLFIISATDMGLNPGEVRVINPADITEMFMMTTHNMPLDYLIDQSREDIGEVIFFDIQPDIAGSYYPMTQPVKDAVEVMYQRLEGQEGSGDFAQLATEEKQFLSREFRELNIKTGACAFLLSLVLPAQATNSTEYLPMSDSEHAQKRVSKPLLTISCDADQNWYFRKMGVVGVALEKMPNEDDYWQLTTKDRAGKSWFVPVGMLRNMAGNVQFHRVDPDRDSVQDLAIWQSVSGNGLAPSSFLVSTTFNQQGHPYVFQVGGLYTVNEAGIGDLLDLQGNDHIQLPDMQSDSDYWITSLYQIEEAKWQRVHGWFGKLNYPTLTRFTYTFDRKFVIKPIARHNPQTKDLALIQRCLIKDDVPGGVNQN